MHLTTQFTFASLALTLLLGSSASVARADASRDAGLPNSRSPRGNPAVADADTNSESKALPRSNRAITPPNGGKKTKRGSTSVLRTIGALLFIVTLIVIGARLLRKHTPRLNGGIPPEAMEVLGKRTIDQRQVVHMIRLGSRILVIGGSPQGLQTLAEITDPVEVDYLAGMCRRDETETRFTQGFLALFRRQPTTEPTVETQAAHGAPADDPHGDPAPASYPSVHPTVAFAERLNEARLASAENRHV